jgi:hypothetical protein
MFYTIVNIFRQQAREHKTIRAFYYSRNCELGAGSQSHPLFWLEDPITGRNRDNVFVNSVNFAILFLPQALGKTPVHRLQNLAFSIGLNIIERIRHSPACGISIHPDWTYTTLRDYYDNNACGCRFSVDFTQLNMQNLCLIDAQFDPAKRFETQACGPDCCEVFARKLPDFDIKTAK